MSRNPAPPHAAPPTRAGAPGGAGQDHADARNAVQAIWVRAADKVICRVGVLEEAVAALREGRLDDEQRAVSVREAHKLAGTVGSFGFVRGSELARELEEALERGGAAAPEVVSRLTELVGGLRADLEAGLPAVGQPPAPADGADERLVLLVDDDVALGARLRAEARARGLRLEVCESPARARRAIDRQSPAVVLLDLSFDDGADEALGLLEDLAGASPPVPALVLTAHETLTDRVEVMRRGAHGFLPKSLPITQVLDTVTDLLRRRQADESTVLAVDDDEAILELLKATLTPCGLNVVTLTEPLAFWDALERSAPELLILDLDMPDLSGLELCRVVRNDARLVSLPVLFLTGRTDPDTLTRAFQAGADDYVTKPIVGPELVARITNRLERTRLHRRLAETDALTGLANRRKGEQAATTLLRLAGRLQQPVSVGVIDLDLMKLINDRLGHAAGDEALRRVAALLGNSFRGEDVVARWGGEEFLIAMYGLAKHDAVERLAQVLEELRAQHLAPSNSEALTVTFSAGVAQYPDDGTDLPALYRAADAALYQAKALGRDQVRPARDARSASAVMDVVIATHDEALAEPLTRALCTRGYRSIRLVDGHDGAGRSAAQDPLLDARLVLLDPRLPGLDGLRRRIGRNGRGMTKIIMLTGEGECGDTRRRDLTGGRGQAHSVPLLLRRIRHSLAG